MILVRIYVLADLNAVFENLDHNKYKQMKIAAAGITTLLMSLGNAETIGEEVKHCIEKNLIGECTDCEYRYILKNGMCQPVSLQCKQWSPLTGQCLSCYDGWNLSEGACTVEVSTSETGTGEPAVTKCGFKEYLKDGKCLPVSEQCNTWSEETGDCLTCYDGWTLKDGACVVEAEGQASDGSGTGTQTGGSGSDTSGGSGTSDGGSGTGTTDGSSGDGSGTSEGGSGSGTSDGGSGTESGGNVGALVCGFKQYPKDGKCLPVSQQCNTWSSQTGDCLTCYFGWTLKDGACIISEIGGGSTGDGTKCGFKQYPKDGQCLPVSQQCNTWSSQTGDCLTCYDGWTLKDGACVV